MITPAQCRAARAWLNMNQAELAQLAGCGLSAVAHFEGERVKTLRVVVEAIHRVLIARGITFIQSLDGTTTGIEGATAGRAPEKIRL